MIVNIHVFKKYGGIHAYCDQQSIANTDRCLSILFFNFAHFVFFKFICFTITRLVGRSFCDDLKPPQFQGHYQQSELLAISVPGSEYIYVSPSVP